MTLGKGYYEKQAPDNTAHFTLIQKVSRNTHRATHTYDDTDTHTYIHYNPYINPKPPFDKLSSLASCPVVSHTIRVNIPERQHGVPILRSYFPTFSNFGNFST